MVPSLASIPYTYDVLGAAEILGHVLEAPQ